MRKKLHNDTVRPLVLAAVQELDNPFFADLVADLFLDYSGFNDIVWC